MSRRARALAFLAAALVCAALAASLASGYGTRLEQRYGPLRPVLVAGADIAAGQTIDARLAAELEVRRVPVRFVPPDAIASPGEALGRAPAAVVPSGSYLLAAQLGPAGKLQSGSGLPAGRSPVEIAVTGAEAIAAASGADAGSPVDVVVTEESDAGAPGRTYVAARDVELLDLHKGDGDVGDGGPTWTATLALTHSEALKLIAAENFARQVRLLP